MLRHIHFQFVQIAPAGIISIKAFCDTIMDYAACNVSSAISNHAFYGICYNTRDHLLRETKEILIRGRILNFSPHKLLSDSIMSLRWRKKSKEFHE